jgi:hypothetical protein
MSTIDNPLPRAIVRDAIRALGCFVLQRTARREPGTINVVRLRPRPRIETVDDVATAQTVTVKKETLAG